MAKVAALHTAQMEKEFSDEIRFCADKSIAFSDGIVLEKHDSKPNNIILEEMTTVEAIYKYSSDGVVAALNFASYKSPGGMFVIGSTAQEEMLCHNSILYNVLSKCKWYYDGNSVKNKALYTNRALFSPNIIFKNDSGITTCNIITCAAPNIRAARRYCGVGEKENRMVLESRINFVFDVAEAMCVETFILGAFGCGVFGQNPITVASMMAKRQENTTIKNIIYAIPDKDSANFKAFEKVMKNCK